MTVLGKVIIDHSPYMAGKSRHIQLLSLDIQPVSVKSGCPAVELLMLCI
jgi:hypothetical protein